MTPHIVWTDLGDARMSADMPLPDDTRQVLKKDAPALRFNADQPRDKDGKFGSGGGSVVDDTHTKSILTHAGAKELLDKLNVDGLKIVGSVALKGASSHDLDLLAPSKGAADEARVKLEANGFEWMGSGGVSPKEAARYGEGKTYGDKSLWSVNDKFEHKETGEKLEVWHKEKGEDRSLRFNADQPRDKDGKFSMGNVASFTNEKDGVSAHVTSYNGRLHVTLVDDDSKNVIGSSIFSGEGMKDKAIDKAQKLAGVKSK